MTSFQLRECEHIPNFVWAYVASEAGCVQSLDCLHVTWAQVPHSTVVKYNIAPEGSTQCQNFTCGTSNALLLLRYYHNIDLLH
jgi:hypothetical protein